MRNADVLPGGNLGTPRILVALRDGQPRLNADLAGIAAGLTG